MSNLPPLPADDDLRRLVQFSASDGRIWLAGQRMVLLHAAALGTLRGELMRSIGTAATRRLLMRAGYASGERDAALARRLRADTNPFTMFSTGPQLHMLEGAVRVTPEHLDMDVAEGRFHGIFRWDHSWEVETHVREFGPQSEPVCWMLLGYASGYTSAYMGRTILYREVQCEACGHPHCLIEGRPVAEWDDGGQMAKDYAPEQLTLLPPDLVSGNKDVPAPAADAIGPLIGRSDAFSRAIHLLRKAASTQVTVLLTGETGVGKERFAQALHALSPRKDKPFVAVNCAALPTELIESELFGAEKGAYTGSTAARPGRFERADGGTLFLDELGDLPLSAQAKLLRVLQDGQVERLGSTQPRRVDVRLVTATNVDLQQAVQAGRFRQDLYYRVHVYPIRIPPLRDRAEDIEPLARHLLTRFTSLHHKPLVGFSDRALDAMKSHPWPGNVRELENLVERGVILASPGGVVEAEDLFPGLHAQHTLSLTDSGALAPSRSGPLADLVQAALGSGTPLETLEAALIQEAVKQHKGNLSAAARHLGLSRPQLSYRLGRITSEQGKH